jgi:hypothetical protein
MVTSASASISLSSRLSNRDTLRKKEDISTEPP